MSWWLTKRPFHNNESSELDKLSRLESLKERRNTVVDATVQKIEMQIKDIFPILYISCGGVGTREKFNKISNYSKFLMWPKLLVKQLLQVRVRGCSSFVNYIPADLSVNDFHHLSDLTLEHIQDMLTDDAYADNGDDMDVNSSQGVLNIHIPSKGTWVINKQTPNRQLWWSSPISGYFFQSTIWFYSN